MNYEKKDELSIVRSVNCPICKCTVSTFTDVCPTCGFPYLKGYGNVSSKITLILKKDSLIKGTYGIRILSKKNLPIAIENKWLEHRDADVDFSAPDTDLLSKTVSFFHEDEIEVNICHRVTKSEDGYWWHVLEKVTMDTPIPKFKPNATYEVYFKMYTYETSHIFGIKKRHNAVKASITKIN